MSTDNALSPFINACGELPYKLRSDGNDLQCEWLHLDGLRFTEPFFDDTIARLKFQPGHQNRRITGLNEMIEASGQIEEVKPAAIVFHISRCGSTLVSQAFATSNRFIVLPEVPFFDEILRLSYLHPTLADKYNTDQLLTAALQFYAMKRFKTDENALIKADCWHIFFYEKLRGLFPDTPFVLMYRNPAEVLRSLQKKAGIQIIPDIVEPQVFGLPGASELYNTKEYASVIIEKMLEKFITVSNADKNALLVNYNEGPAALIDKIAAFCHFGLDDHERAVIAERIRYSSKEPEALFLKEPPAETPASVMPAMERYQLLENMRLKP